MKYFLVISTTFLLNFTNLTTLPTSQSDNENEKVYDEFNFD